MCADARRAAENAMHAISLWCGSPDLPRLYLAVRRPMRSPPPSRRRQQRGSFMNSRRQAAWGGSGAGVQPPVPLTRGRRSHRDQSRSRQAPPPQQHDPPGASQLSAALPVLAPWATANTESFRTVLREWQFGHAAFSASGCIPRDKCSNVRPHPLHSNS